MANDQQKRVAMPTIWRCPDDLWERLVWPVMQQLDPPPKMGRKRIDQRAALDGVIYHMRTGCQWEALPREFGDDSSVHRTLTRWIDKGVIQEVWAVLIGCCEDLDSTQWAWQSADGFMGKARFGGTLPARTRRIAAKAG
jgi:putative transposase